jgi:hypothetical protein
MEAHASQMQTRNYVELQLARARVHGLAAGLEPTPSRCSPTIPPVLDSLAAAQPEAPGGFEASHR